MPQLRDERSAYSWMVQPHQRWPPAAPGAQQRRGATTTRQRPGRSPSTCQLPVPMVASVGGRSMIQWSPCRSWRRHRSPPRRPCSGASSSRDADPARQFQQRIGSPSAATCTGGSDSSVAAMRRVHAHAGEGLLEHLGRDLLVLAPERVVAQGHAVALGFLRQVVPVAFKAHKRDLGPMRQRAAQAGQVPSAVSGGPAVAEDILRFHRAGPLRGSLDRLAPRLMSSASTWPSAWRHCTARPRSPMRWKVCWPVSSGVARRDPAAAGGEGAAHHGQPGLPALCPSRPHRDGWHRRWPRCTGRAAATAGRPTILVTWPNSRLRPSCTAFFRSPSQSAKYSQGWVRRTPRRGTAWARPASAAPAAWQRRGVGTGQHGQALAEGAVAHLVVVVGEVHQRPSG
jgi:hypothetical protein